MGGGAVADEREEGVLRLGAFVVAGAVPVSGDAADAAHGGRWLAGVVQVEHEVVGAVRVLIVGWVEVGKVDGRHGLGEGVGVGAAHVRLAFEV